MAKKYTKSEIEGMIKNLKEKEKKARSKWGKAVLQDAQWLLENVIELMQGDEINEVEITEKYLLNGAKNWEQFSVGGNALVYEGEIAEHYLTPSDLKSVGYDEANCSVNERPSERETWYELQARALRQAWWAIRDEMNGTTEFSMSLCEFEEKKGKSNFDMDKDEYWGLLIEYGIATEDELQLITDINGYSEETLDDVLYARTGYRSWEQYCEANGIEIEDDDDDDTEFSIEETNVRSKGGSSSNKYFCVLHANAIESIEKVGDKKITRFWSFVPNGNFKSFVESENGTPKRSIEKNSLGSYNYKEEYPCGELQYTNGKLRFVLYEEAQENVVIKKGDSLGFIKNRYVWRTIKDAFDNFNARKIKKYTFKEVYDNLKNEGFKEIEYLSREYGTHFSIIDDTKDVLRATGKLAGNIVKNTTDKGGLLMF